MKTKFLVSIPEAWINLKNYIIDLNDVGEFYTNLLTVLKGMDADVETTTVIKKLLKSDGIFLSHHTNLTNDNVWNIKKGYLNDYLYFDKTGYSGWAEMANNEELFNKTQEVDIDIATKFFDEFSENYKKNRSTKIRQSKQAFTLREPYVFVAGQRPHDTVSEWAYIPTIELMEKVAIAFQGSKYKVVIKIHPLEIIKKETYAFLKKYDNVVLTESDIHDIIPRAAAVYTTNSGVGFESLLYLKHVFVSGHCDYHWAGTKLHDISDIKLSISQISTPINKEKIIKFIHYMLTEYFVNSKDLNSIRKKIEYTIKEYNEVQNGSHSRSSKVRQSLD